MSEAGIWGSVMKDSSKNNRFQYSLAAFPIQAQRGDPASILVLILGVRYHSPIRCALRPDSWVSTWRVQKAI